MTANVRSAKKRMVPEGGEKESPVELPCGHIFGHIRITAWLNENKSCPFCRRMYDLQPLHQR
jgi:hypothetical protein